MGRHILPRFFVFLVLIAACNFPGGTWATCCQRSVGYLPVRMPEGQVQEFGNFIEAGFFSSLLTLEADITDCPKEAGFYNVGFRRVTEAYINYLLEQGNYAADPESTTSERILGQFDYMFVPSLTMDDVVGFDEESGFLLGHFRYSMQLMDMHHGAELMENSTTWFEGRNIKDIFKSHEDMLEASRSLGSQFMPIDDIIHDYERLPESLSIEPEKERVLNNEEMTIRLVDISDSEGKSPQPWWRILVEIEEGEILNAEARWGDYYFFRVGYGGSVDVQYRAPAECPCSRSETVKVHNTCEMNETLNPGPEKEVAAETFEILCSNFELDIDYRQVLRLPIASFVDERIHAGTVEFSANTETEPPSLEGESTTNLFGNGSAEECQWDNRGTVDVSVGGEFLVEGEDEPRLVVELENTFYQTSTIYCEGVHDIPQFPVMVPSEQEFPYEDGYTLEWDIGLPGLPLEGKAIWVLHIPCVE